MSANATAAEEAPKDQTVYNDEGQPRHGDSSDLDQSSGTASSSRSDLSTQSAPATLLDARHILYDHLDADFNIPALGQPYSLPNPHRWANVSKWKWKNSLRSTNLSTLHPTSWHTDMAARPLLLTFDAFDTLFTPTEPIAKQYRDVALEYSLDFAEDDIMASFKSAFKSMNQTHPNYGKDTGMDPQTWWTRLIHNTLTPLLTSAQQTTGLPHDLPQTLYHRFSSSEGYTLFPDVLPFLLHVGTSSFSRTLWPPRRTMLGVISNSDPRVRSILSSFGIPISPALFPPRYAPHSRFARRAPDFGPAGFAFATLSYEAGYSKPDRMIYDQAVRDAQAALDELHPVGRLSRTGGEALKDVHAGFHHMHVGDDVEKDVLPALDLGWDAILLDRGQEQEVGVREIEGKRVTVINSLMALRRIVTKERLDERAEKNPVWIDLEGKGPVRRRQRRGRELKGRNIVRHPLSSRTMSFSTLL